MAPSRTRTVKSKHASNKSGLRKAGSSSGSSGGLAAQRIDGAVSKTKRSKSKGAPQNADAARKQQQRRRGGQSGGAATTSSAGTGTVKADRLATLKKKRRVYTPEELGVPKLNMITPMGVEARKGAGGTGKRKGKVFVDDPESMLTIFALVAADKDGQIESKMMRARQLEEIREARRREVEIRQEGKRAHLEDVKRDVKIESGARRKAGRRRVGDADADGDGDADGQGDANGHGHSHGDVNRNDRDDDRNDVVAKATRPLKLRKVVGGGGGRDGGGSARVSKDRRPKTKAGKSVRFA